jgi:branched-chain amino acid transport system ATP-binding protein
MLRVRRLSKAFGGVRAVDDCTFTVRRGSVTGLIGPNGAGKTTVFNLITGFYGPTSGAVYFKGKRIDSLPPHRVARLGIGRTFQLIRLFRGLSVLENLLVAKKAHHGEGIIQALVGTKKCKSDESENIERCMEILGFVSLEGSADTLAGNLGYGEQKLLEIGRVLALDPELILLDEPMAGLERNMKKKLIGFIRTLRDREKTFFIIEHDMGTIMDMCDEIVVLDHGTEIACGTPAEIQANKQVIDAYLGTEDGFGKKTMATEG